MEPNKIKPTISISGIAALNIRDSSSATPSPSKLTHIGTQEPVQMQMSIKQELILAQRATENAEEFFKHRKPHMQTYIESAEKALQEFLINYNKAVEVEKTLHTQMRSLKNTKDAIANDEDAVQILKEFIQKSSADLNK